MSNRTRSTKRTASSPPRRRSTVRIIGGRWRRSVLQVVDVPGLRPTPDRVRETLFNWLSHAMDGLDGRVVLDLFAGSGVLGFEAASRGAARVVLVEAHAGAVHQLTAAWNQLGSDERIEIRSGDARVIGASLQAAGTVFDLILLDPPFGHRWLDNALPLAAALCRASGFVYAEAEAPLDPDEMSALGFEIHRADRAGEVFYYLLRRNTKEP